MKGRQEESFFFSSLIPHPSSFLGACRQLDEGEAMVVGRCHFRGGLLRPLSPLLGPPWHAVLSGAGPQAARATSEPAGGRFSSPLRWNWVFVGVGGNG